MTTDAEIAGTKTVRLMLPGQATAGTADEWPVFKPKRNAKILAVRFTPKSALTHDGTNFFTMNLRNRGQADAGTTAIATHALSAGDVAARAVDTLTMSATATDANVNAGDQLTVEKVNSGTGMALPIGSLEIDYQER